MAKPWAIIAFNFDNWSKIAISLEGCLFLSVDRTHNATIIWRFRNKIRKTNFSFFYRSKITQYWCFNYCAIEVALKFYRMRQWKRRKHQTFSGLLWYCIGYFHRKYASLVIVFSTKVFYYCIAVYYRKHTIKACLKVATFTLIHGSPPRVLFLVGPLSLIRYP